VADGVWSSDDLPLRPGALLEFKAPAGCDPRCRRRMVTAWIPEVHTIPGVWVPGVHAACNHNEYVALMKRTLAPTPAPVESCLAQLADVFRRLRAVARRYSGERWSYLETAQSYTGALRRRYLEAERSLREDGPLTARDVQLRAFLKAEKFNRYSKFQKPRMIFPRSPRYNLVLASRLKPFEHWLWRKLQSVGHFRSSKTRVVAKGLDGWQRAALIRAKMAAVPDCVVVEVDGATFEAHISPEVLRMEHSVYEAAFPGDRELSRLLRAQLTLAGVTSGGVKFRREGARASGDYNTGMGNTLVMLAVITWALERLPFVRRAELLVDGDNALLFLPRSVLHQVQRLLPRVVVRVGFEMTLERPVSVLEQVRFGQSAPVEVAPGRWFMVRDWRKVLSHACSSHVHLREPRFARKWLHGVARCEAALASRVPILWKWATSLMEATRSGAAPLPLDRYPDYKFRGVTAASYAKAEVLPPCEVGRASFFRAFGVSPETQVAVESRLERLSLDLDRVETLEVPPLWWAADPRLAPHGWDL